MTSPLLHVDGDRFVLGGRPHQIISGGIHYFRIHPDLWEDRLCRVRAMGLNTVETYVAWNVHERRPGRFDFTRERDFPRFVSLAGDLGLDVILRPGPYICAEWDFGGLPAWLMRDPSARLRCADETFLRAVDEWFDALVPVVLPLLRSQGGPVVAVQIENEYGSYGDDHAYLDHCRNALVERGVDVLLLTSDGPDSDYLASGTLPDVLATANFGSRPAAAFASLRAAMPTGPLMCMEFWNGWFDHWGERHHIRDPHDAATVLDEMLASGASVNLYMAHGGTNPGLWNGANVTDDGRYEPTVTSYDYDAPVSESGDLTPKFYAFRKVIGRYVPLPTDPLPAPPPRVAPATAAMTGWARLTDSLNAFGTEPIRTPMPMSMEELGQDHGLVLYRGSALVPPGGADLVLDGLADRAIVLADGTPVGSVSRNDPRTSVELQPRRDGQRTSIELVVENQGRVNYGPRMGERKGLVAARLGQRLVHGWQNLALPVDADGLTERIRFGRRPPEETPVFAHAVLHIPEPADGFLALPGWAKGFLWLNGVLLGRYWEIGPQETVYAPAPLWRTGENSVVVLELERSGTHVELRDVAILG
ncbi:beta-galactosidase family protein [Pedococcus sp.]|uniref:glycoside hydrolase family 35 protein n=1 Tax=Pedococcus sp. TaxID=2860345 RepID=UPI002E11D46B|nr:beta-galactosidase family protein [Pedococcus sp.]